MLKVLIAEDDLFIADMLADVLVESGYEVCGIARTVKEGVELGERHKPDLAILDLRLAAGGLGTEIAAKLDGPSRPGILYATGNSGEISLTKADGEAWLGKPYRPDEIVTALKIVEQMVEPGGAQPPSDPASFPRTFHVLRAPANGAASRGATAESGEIKRLRRQQAALASFGSYALGEPDLQKVLTEAARVCAEGLNVPFCKICRYRLEEDDMIIVAGVGWKHGVVGRVVSQANASSPQGRAFSTGQPVICDDLREDSGFVLPSFYADHGIISTIDVVIRNAGQAYGVLEIDNPVQHNYDRHDIDFVTGFANVLAAAVDRHAHVASLQNALGRMQDMVADRDRLLVAKNAALEEKNALLVEKNRLLEDKNVLAQELQHRVRNNLQLVYGMVSKQQQATADATGKEGLGAIGRRVMTLAQVYNHLLGAGLSREIDFGGYLSSLCSSIESLQPPPHDEVVLTCHAVSLMLDLDSVTALGLVISELISNSYEHAFPDGRGAITVSLSPDPATGGGRIIFADDGVGFKGPEDNKRHGLGLVRRLMQQVGGTATLVPGQGTQWTLRFPLPEPAQPNAPAVAAG